MTRSTGEHELVLGNKQLLSAFFVIAILLGVFFTMGYFVGRNTATAGGLNPGPSGYPVTSRPDGSGKPSGGGVAPGTSGEDSGAGSESSSNALPTPAPPPAESTPKPSTPAGSESAAPDRQADRDPAAGQAHDAGRDQAPVRPNAEQMYLQVFALRRPDADNEVKVLRERGFPALIGESSKKGIFRVLVGPFKTQTEMGHTKSDLKAKGFDSIVAR